MSFGGGCCLWVGLSHIIATIKKVGQSNLAYFHTQHEQFYVKLFLDRHVKKEKASKQV